MAAQKYFKPAPKAKCEIYYTRDTDVFELRYTPGGKFDVNDPAAQWLINEHGNETKKLFLGMGVTADIRLEFNYKKSADILKFVKSFEKQFDLDKNTLSGTKDWLEYASKNGKPPSRPKKDL